MLNQHRPLFSYVEDSRMLDFYAARASARAHLFERAVHDRGPWAIRIGSQTSPATKVRTKKGVIFLAHFDSSEVPDDTVAWLLCAGEEISSRELGPQTEPVGALEWRMSLGSASVDPVSV